MRRWLAALMLLGGAALAQDDAARVQLEQRIKLNALGKSFNAFARL